jgi:hypothetical protein
LQESFEKAQKLVDDQKRSGGVRMVLAMAGNKLDLAEQRQVPQEKALAYAEENGIFFIETSAKTSQNVRGIVLFLSFPFLSFPSTTNACIFVKRERLSRSFYLTCSLTTLTVSPNVHIVIGSGALQPHRTQTATRAEARGGKN